MTGIIEYILIGLLCFTIGVSVGNDDTAVRQRQPDKQLIIYDSTKVVNIYIDNYGNHWRDPYYTTRAYDRWTRSLWLNFVWNSVVVVHNHNGKRYKMRGHKYWKKYNKKRF